jgi:hypothetical protein
MQKRKNYQSGWHLFCKMFGWQGRDVLQAAVPINIVQKYFYTKMQKKTKHRTSFACQQYKRHEMGRVFHQFTCKHYDLGGIYTRTCDNGNEHGTYAMSLNRTHSPPLQHATEQTEQTKTNLMRKCSRSQRSKQLRSTITTTD